MRIVEIYTDGACSGNPGPGGWAAILSFMGNEKIVKVGKVYIKRNGQYKLVPIENICMMLYIKRLKNVFLRLSCRRSFLWRRIEVVITALTRNQVG